MQLVGCFQLALLFFLLLYALRSISQRVLGLDFPVIRMNFGLNTSENWQDCRRIVLAPSQAYIHELAKKLKILGTIREFDLSEVEDQQQLLKFAAQQEHHEHDVVVLKAAKVFNIDRSAREPLLQAIENLNTRPQTSLILRKLL